MINKDFFIKTNYKSTRDGFGDALVELGKKNKDIVVLSANLAESTRVDKFAKKYPDRFIECGVAEQNMVGVAVGLALSNKIPFVSSFAAFSPGRNWDQLRVSVCYTQANVKIVSTHSGLAVGPDGASHQALEDLAITRCLPNLIVLAPCDYNQTKQATLAAAKINSPVYIRLTRQNSPMITAKNSRYTIGKADILIPGKDITVIANGPILSETLLAAQELKKKNISVEVINNHTIKPLDAKTILKSIKKTKRLITVEDHQIMGGMGSAITELLSQKYPVKTIMIGVQDTFGESGTQEELWNKYKISKSHIITAILKLVK